MAEKSVAATSASDIRSRRLPVEKFAASMWGDTFTSFSFDTQVQERYAEDIKVLKEEVRKMFTVEENHTLNGDKLILIDTLERLGVAYHFKQEIEDQLQHMISNFHSEHHDLFITSLGFRLLRQHHHQVSSRVFDKFKGKDGKLDEEVLCGNAKGLLNLYEAAHVKAHGEDILEEGLAIATHHLNLMAPTLKCPLQDQVKRALEQPLHRGISRMEVHRYISIYERDDACNEVLLKLAKLDFNYLQNLYRKELHDLCRWWDKFDLKSKLPYIRDRVPEAYIWSIAIDFEPHNSFLREAIVKIVLSISILDDTYDNYATVEEADVFTEILQRWDINEIDRLPEYMKVVYKFILDTYEELLHEGSKRGRSFAVPYSKEVITEIGRCYNEELKWLMGIQTPTLETYNSYVVMTGGVYVLCTGALLGMESASHQVCAWLFNRPKLALASTKIGRYKGDLGSHERESRNGEMLTSITSYMKQHGVTKEEALKRFTEMVENAWKDLNAEWLSLPSFVPHDIANAVLNYGRSCEIIYKNSEDGYTSPEKFFATEIAEVLVNPLII